MRLNTVTNANEIKLPGLKVDGEIINDQLTSVCIRNEAGEVLAKFACDSYSFRAYVPAPPKLVKRHQVFGSIHGVPVNELRTDAREAARRADQLNEAGGTVSVQEIELTEEAAQEADDDALVF